MAVTVETCQNCKAHGAEWIRRDVGHGAKKQHSHWSSCRREIPTIGPNAPYVGNDDLMAEAYAGQHPFVPFGYWCMAWVEGEDSTAVTIEFGALALRPKQPTE